MPTTRLLMSVPDDDWPDLEPTPTELDAVDEEMPLILAEVEELDARIATFDRAPSQLDQQRLRRARTRVLTARRQLTNEAHRAAEREMA